MESLLSEVYKFSTHSVVMRDDKASFDEVNSVTYIKVCDTAVPFSLKFRGINIITCA